MVETGETAEPTADKATGQIEDARVDAFREGERAKMARTLARMLRLARREARRRDAPSLIRLRWVNTVAYLTQTYNSLLRDTEVDELREQMTILQERLRKLAQSRPQ